MILPAILWCASAGKCAGRFWMTEINDDKFLSRRNWSHSAGAAKHFFWRQFRAMDHSVLRHHVRDQRIDDRYVPAFW